MTVFQETVLKRLTPLLEKRGIKQPFEPAGIRDKHLHMRDAGVNLDVWVYEDEVAFRMGSHHLQCEKQDFDDSEEMIRFFLEQLTRQLGERSTEMNRDR